MIIKYDTLISFPCQRHGMAFLRCNASTNDTVKYIIRRIFQREPFPFQYTACYLCRVGKHLLRNNTKTERQGSVNLFHFLLPHTLLYFLMFFLFCKISSNFCWVSLNSFITSSTFPRLRIKKTQLAVEFLSFRQLNFSNFQIISSEAVFGSFCTNIQMGKLTLDLSNFPIFQTHFRSPKWFYKSGFHLLNSLSHGYFFFFFSLFYFLTLQYCLVTLLELHKPTNRTRTYTTGTPQITQITQSSYKTCYYTTVTP